ncbi:hypothetical protein GCM10007907_04180 [Chitinimonas prasina]|uniref:Uncharacterized protein n=1 Tax=Chitinimonas prasina TaxID=1434937 RepID=A0ABQ5YC65_9NEIS|nr:hypothetical protein GCM10007907_04180 [Chitinimonas prasina]
MEPCRNAYPMGLSGRLRWHANANANANADADADADTDTDTDTDTKHLLPGMERGDGLYRWAAGDLQRP